MWVDKMKTQNTGCQSSTRKNRRVEDIMIVSVDGLTGFGDAIHAVFPQAEIQRCIVHQIRYSTKFISYKDLKSFMADLKLVYKADTEDLALTALDDLEEKWSKKYPASNILIFSIVHNDISPF